MKIKIFNVENEIEIKNCFNAFSELRSHLSESDFLIQVKRQQEQGYQIIALAEADTVVSVAGYRLAEFLAWGKILYIDDLSTVPQVRKKGYAGQLLNKLTEYAKENKCNAVHLDTGHGRHSAHKLYLKQGFEISSHHMSLVINQD